MADPFIGEIRMVGFPFAPKGWALCEGQLMAISTNNALFALLGTTYGGDGRTTFALPDLRGRLPAGTGNGPGLPPVGLGQIGGAPTASLTAAQLPPHVHNFAVPCNNSADASTGSPGNAYPAVTATRTGGTPIYTAASDNSSMGGGTTASAGAGMPLPTMSPYLGINFAIALEGIFPTRN